MKDHKRETNIEKRAGEFFTNGYHCAEAVVAAVAPTLEKFSPEEIKLATKCATPFGGGLGRSFEEMCGVISGASILIGLAYGREKAGDDWGLPAELSVKFRNWFSNKYGETNCGALCDRFGEDQLEECRNLVMFGAQELLKILSEKELSKD